MSRRFRSALVLTASLLVAGAGLAVLQSGAEEARVIPPPALDAPTTSAAASEVAVLAGGCFWGVQGVFQHVNGVTNAVSGYAGGEQKTARYDVVTSGTTGHAESVAITFDPRRISYGRILQIYFSVGHDPTELNRQGPDVGTQYRSAIFFKTPAQKTGAQAYIDQLAAAKKFPRAIVTQVAPLTEFYRAEDYHQDYFDRHPDEPYIVYNDRPKVDSLRKAFPSLYVER
jgi:peptide-methionine (S)-S-oxide reductase